MKTLTRGLFSLCCIALALASCKKKDPIVTEKEYLFSKTWKVSKTDKNPSTNPPGAIVYDAAYCNSDDKYQFKEGNALTVIKEKGDCYLYKPDDVSGSYNLTTKELIYGGKTYKIAEISPKQIKFYVFVPDGTLVFLLE